MQQALAPNPQAPHQYMEHRWGTRVSLEQPVRLEIPGCTALPGLLVNASVSGAYIATPTRLRPLTAVTVVLEDAKGARIELPACVARIGDDGIGVEWRDMACPKLIQLLLQANGDASLLERDTAFT